MTNPVSTAKRSQGGFTLVELAIVMIIIGLLIGGVLKGQELINNAQVTATVSQVKSIEAATSTFRDVYSALPGDMLAPTTRLPNCTAAPCNVPGNGDGRLSNTPAQTPVGAEGENFFVHLSAADLLTGIVPGSTSIGGNYPGAKINGVAILAGSATTAANLGGAISTLDASAGLYLVLTDTIGAQSATTLGLKPTEALRIDTKLDDGTAITGTVRARGATCATAGVYATNTAGQTCGLYIRIQG
ncbi:MAG: prepilin-type N-terminal cleavage/methylation domain-containing protein [Micavibrio aeruginosavorus]|nr:prepilin-type N-terminal cleavage/methylation domain-containing protein [Micavibrio aeruginosavorus]